MKYVLWQTNSSSGSYLTCIHSPPDWRSWAGSSSEGEICATFKFRNSK
ncbi:MAG TPA: hypothetical protein VK872_05755 [Draconibacterium sp.]|nr:hypothetical protein [Draconibacterium sp.]